MPKPYSEAFKFLDKNLHVLQVVVDVMAHNIGFYALKLSFDLLTNFWSVFLIYTS